MVGGGGAVCCTGMYEATSRTDCVIGPAGGGGAALGSLEGKGDGWKRGFGGAAPMETKISQFSYPCGNALPPMHQSVAWQRGKSNCLVTCRSIF